MDVDVDVDADADADAKSDVRDVEAAGPDADRIAMEVDVDGVKAFDESEVNPNVWSPLI